MGRLRFELRTNRLKANWTEPKLQAGTERPCTYAKETAKSQDDLRQVNLSNRDLRYARDFGGNAYGCPLPPPTELPSARPARIVSPWLTASSMRLRGWAQKTPVGSKALSVEGSGCRGRGAGCWGLGEPSPGDGCRSAPLLSALASGASSPGGPDPAAGGTRPPA